MEIWQGAVLGLIQGLTEFLPVSSSGHLLLFEKLGVGDENLLFNVAVHLATLLAVVIAMRKELWPLLRHPINRTNLFIIVASIPTIGFALLFDKVFPSLISGAILPLGFMLTAFLLVLSENVSFCKTNTLSSKNAFIIGVFQGFAILPGLSRSGSTIAAARLCGVDKNTAATFSFLLSIPIILGSGLYEGYKLYSNPFALLNVNVWAIVVGMLCAFAAGLVAIKFFLKLLRNHTFYPFAIYTVILSVVTLVLRGVGLM